MSAERKGQITIGVVSIMSIVLGLTGYIYVSDKKEQADFNRTLAGSIESLARSQADISSILARQDERIKFLENRK